MNRVYGYMAKAPLSWTFRYVRQSPFFDHILKINFINPEYWLCGNKYNRNAHLIPIFSILYLMPYMRIFVFKFHIRHVTRTPSYAKLLNIGLIFKKYITIIICTSRWYNLLRFRQLYSHPTLIINPWGSKMLDVTKTRKKV